MGYIDHITMYVVTMSHSWIEVKIGNAKIVTESIKALQSNNLLNGK